MFDTAALSSRLSRVLNKIFNTYNSVSIYRIQDNDGYQVNIDLKFEVSSQDIYLHGVEGAFKIKTEEFLKKIANDINNLEK